MSRNLHESSTERRVSQNRFATKRVRQRPLAYRWWVPGCTAGDEGCTGDEPALVNGFAQPSIASGLEPFGFRLHTDGSLQFKGHLDVSDATSGTVAFTLPGANAGETDFLDLDIGSDQVYPIMVTTSGGVAGVIPATASADRATGDVTVHWSERGFESDRAIEYLWSFETARWSIGSSNTNYDDFNLLTRDRSIDFGGYFANSGGNGTEMFVGAPLGPRWSTWQLQWCRGRGPDYGILKVQVAVVPFFRRCEGVNDTFPGSSLNRFDIPSPQSYGDYDFIWHDLPCYTTDCYNAVESFNNFDAGGACTFKITGEYGALLTDTDTGLCEALTSDSWDSGDGMMYFFRLYMDGKNAASTAHRMKFQAIRLARITEGDAHLI